MGRLHPLSMEITTKWRGRLPQHHTSCQGSRLLLTHDHRSCLHLRAHWVTRDSLLWIRSATRHWVIIPLDHRHLNGRDDSLHLVNRSEQRLSTNTARPFILPIAFGSASFHKRNLTSRNLTLNTHSIRSLSYWIIARLGLTFVRQIWAYISYTPTYTTTPLSSHN